MTVTIILAIIIGMAFGWALFITGASNTSKLAAMLRLKDLTLMKIIVFAIGFASVLVAVSSLVGLLDISHFSVKATNLGVIVGGLIFGIGFGWVGTCPGTCVAASTGKGFKKAISAIIGGLLGAFVFSISYGGLDDMGLFRTMDYGKITLFRISDRYDYVLRGSFWGLLIVGLLFVFGALIIPNKRLK